MASLKPEQILKKLSTLVRTRARLSDWANARNTAAWKSARKQIYKRAQEASKIVRQRDWTKTFTPEERTQIKRLFRHVREDILGLLHKLDLIRMESAKKKTRPRKSAKRNPSA